MALTFQACKGIHRNIGTASQNELFFVRLGNEKGGHSTFSLVKSVTICQHIAYPVRLKHNLSLNLRPNRRKSIPVSEEMGAGLLGFFDPLSIASDDNFARNRERELKHGRVAMM